MRRVVVALVAALAVAARVGAQPMRAVLPSDAAGRMDRLASWLKAAAFHEPGEVDRWASLVGSWSTAQIRMLWIDANVLVQVMQNPGGMGFTVRPEGYARLVSVRYTPTEMRRLRVLACATSGLVADVRCVQMKAATELDDELQRMSAMAHAASVAGDGDNFILRRGALLHTDIAMFIPAVSEAIGPSGAGAGPERLRIQTADGLAVDMGQVAAHWEFARMLLEYVRPGGLGRPAPGRDEMVRRWYVATAAWMQAVEQHDTLHLDRARAIFPNDADVLFLSACQHEIYAGPPIQSAIKSTVVPTGVRLEVSAARPELRDAETLFRKAVAANPANVEARLRHGRVLALLERPRDALTELQQALDATDDPLLRYYAQLFLGAVFESLRDFDAARRAYEEAHEQFPSAQSPYVALSALQRRRGDRNGAWTALQQLFALPPAGVAEADPWWVYFRVQARNVDELLADLRHAFRRPDTP